MNRRNWLSLAGGTVAMMMAASAQEGVAQEIRFGRGRRGRGLPKYPNAHFYKNGVFDPEIAKAAYREMFRFHNYSIGESVLNSPDFWTLEFGLDDFSNVGMAGIFFVNDKEHNYFGHEIYLLPGQMIVEHYHVAAENMAAKHEVWQVRHGQIWTFAQGGSAEDLPKGVTLPKSQDGNITCFKGKRLEPGDMDTLNKLEEPHFMLAGPQGAIVTEYASYHSGEGLRFTNPKAKA